jgi:hypothetical protein
MSLIRPVVHILGCGILFLRVHDMPHFLKEDDMGRTCSTNGEMRNKCRILAGMKETIGKTKT